MKTKTLLLIIISIALIACNSSKKDNSIINKGDNKYLLYLNKTDADNLNSVINHNLDYL